MNVLSVLDFQTGLWRFVCELKPLVPFHIWSLPSRKLQRVSMGLVHESTASGAEVLRSKHTCFFFVFFTNTTVYMCWARCFILHRIFCGKRPCFFFSLIRFVESEIVQKEKERIKQNKKGTKQRQKRAKLVMLGNIKSKLRAKYSFQNEHVETPAVQSDWASANLERKSFHLLCADSL